MRALYTDPAAAELDASISYLREHAPALVADFADSITEPLMSCSRILNSAQETEMPGIRRKYVRRFKHSIFYTVAGEALVILHVRHAARRWPWEEE